MALVAKMAERYLISKDIGGELLKAFQKTEGEILGIQPLGQDFHQDVCLVKSHGKIFLPTPKKILGVGNRGSCCAGARETEERARCEVGRGRCMPPLGVLCVGGSRLPVFRCA